MQVLMVSSHVYHSRRRASFHWIADAFARANNNVTFVTAGLSAFSWIKDDYRIEERRRDIEISAQSSNELVRSFPILTYFHPINLHQRLLNRLVAPIWRLYPLQFTSLLKKIPKPDVIVIESGAPVALAKTLKKRFPHATLIYRVSDLLETMGVHPQLLSDQANAMSLFKLVSIPSPAMMRRLPYHSNAVVHPHGLQKELLERVAVQSPFPTNSKQVVCVGTMLLDVEAIAFAAEHMPDVNFHIFGHTDMRKIHNITLHGEVSFDRTLPYVKHCSVGLAPYKLSPSSEYLADTSNKMMQFRFFKVPIVAPEFACTQSWMHSYNPEVKETLVDALRKALASDRTDIPNTEFDNWDDTLRVILAAADTAAITAQQP